MNIWKDAPLKFIDQKKPAFNRDWNVQDFGTGKGNPNEAISSGGLPFRAPVQFNFPVLRSRVSGNVKVTE